MTEARIHEAERTSQGEFEAFYLRTARTLHGYLCRLSGDPATSDEVLQEAYIRMIAAPAMEEQHRKGYLYKTATNILRDHWRKLKRGKECLQLSPPTEHVHCNLHLAVDMSAV